MVLKMRGGLLGDLFLTGSGIIDRYKKGFKGFSDAIKRIQVIILRYKKGSSWELFHTIKRGRAPELFRVFPGKKSSIRKHYPPDPGRETRQIRPNAQAICIPGRVISKGGGV